MTDSAARSAADAASLKPRTAKEAIYRHKLIPRVSHWINLLCLSLLLMSGLQILNAHPRLYWGQYGADADHPFIEFTAVGGDGDHPTGGITRVGPLSLNTTGLLGASKGPDHKLTQRGFPAWLTLPSGQDLATGRRWHFFLAWLFVANGAVYLLYGLISGHFRRDIVPTAGELRPRHLVQDVWDHMRLKHPSGEAAKHYNTLQKLSYGAVIFLLMPLMVLTGLTMSPGMDAFVPALLSVFGGRQSARTLHFLTANLIVLFVIVHVVEVLIAGVWNEMRSMITGWYVVKPEAADERR